MDLIGLTVAILETPILVVMSLENHFNYLMNGLLPQYLPSIYLLLAHLPIPLVPWPQGPGPQ